MRVVIISINPLDTPPKLVRSRCSRAVVPTSSSIAFQNGRIGKIQSYRRRNLMNYRGHSDCRWPFVDWRLSAQKPEKQTLRNMDDLRNHAENDASLPAIDCAAQRYTG